MPTSPIRSLVLAVLFNTLLLAAPITAHAQAMGWLTNIFSGNAKPSSDSSETNAATAATPVALSASEQCVATESSCQKGCLGVAAVGGILSFLSDSLTGRSALLGTTAEQTQQCSNRCTTAKNNCDEQVAALEQSKNQALLNASPQATPAAPGATSKVENSGQSACSIDEGLFQSHAAASQAWSRFIKFQPATTEKIREDITTQMKGYRTSSPEMLQRILIDRRNYIANPGMTGVIAPMSEEQKRMSVARSKLELSMIECELNQRSNAMASTKSPDAPQLQQDGACNLAGFNQKFSELTRDKPQKSNWGMNATYNYSYFLGYEGLRILEGYRNCMSDADFAANYSALVGMRDKGREGCIKTSSSGSCKLGYPG